MVKAVILNCDNIRDKSCIGCERCLKAIREKEGEFARFDSVELVGFLGCGGCPGVIVPRFKQFNKWIEGFDDYEVVFIGKCVVTMVESGSCPIGDLNKLKEIIESKFGKQVVFGTHPW